MPFDCKDRNPDTPQLFTLLELFVLAALPRRPFPDEADAVGFFCLPNGLGLVASLDFFHK